MADVDKTLELIALGKPVSGRAVMQLQLSLRTFEEHGWTHDPVRDLLVPPPAKGGQDGRAA
jgi:hypothetical protein